MGQVNNNNISCDPLHCVSWDFHPMFIWILSLISKKALHILKRRG